MRSLSASNLNFENRQAQYSSQSLFLESCAHQFSREATDASNLFAMSAGSLAFSAARLALAPTLRFLPGFLASGLESALALGLEVSVFRGTLSAFHPESISVLESQDFLKDYVNFASLKGVGFFLHSSHALWRHVFQNFGMMSAEECTVALGLSDQSGLSLGQRFLHASVTNLALEAGGSITHRALGGRNSWIESRLRLDLNKISSSSEARYAVLHARFSAVEVKVTHSSHPGYAQEVSRLFLRYSYETSALERARNLSQINSMDRDLFIDLHISENFLEMVLEDPNLQNRKERFSEILWTEALTFMECYLSNSANPVSKHNERRIRIFLGLGNAKYLNTKLRFIQRFLDRNLEAGLGKSDSQELWDALGMQSIHFGDGQHSYSNIPHFLARFYRRVPSREPLKISRHPLSALRVVSQTQILEEHRIKAEDRQANRGRSLVYNIEAGGRLLVLKETRSPADFYENDVQVALAAAGLVGFLPEAAQREGCRYLVEGENNKTYAAYYADPRYFDYLNDPSLKGDDFRRGILRSARAVGTIARHGLFQTEPLVLYHHRKKTEGSRRYTVCPEFIDPANMSGMGVVDDYNTSLKYPNFSVWGLRDAESILPIQEILNQPGSIFSKIKRRASSELSGEARVEAALVGDNLLAISLLIGSRMAHETSRLSFRQKRILGEENEWLRFYADLFLDSFSEYYAGRRDISQVEAHSTLRSRADWLRLARQSAFFMTPTYQAYIQDHQAFKAPSTKFSREHVFRTLYGNAEVVVMGPYRDEVSGRLIPYWSEGDLGAANGAFPITEFEKAWCAVLFGPNMEEMQD